jgi:hypothetical protein
LDPYRDSGKPYRLRVVSLLQYINQDSILLIPPWSSLGDVCEVALLGKLDEEPPVG